MRAREPGNTESEEKMEEMESRTVARLIEWLKRHNMTAEEIVDCIEYITGKAEKKGKE